MNIKTKYFGDIEIDEKKVIYFEDGIPGFNNLKKYLFMTAQEVNSPFCWLQSIEDLDIVFPMIDVLAFMPDYSPTVDERELESLGDANDEDLAIYNIIVIPKDAKDMTVNLKAPIVINLATMKARQVISNNEEYPVKYQLYKELKNAKAGE